MEKYSDHELIKATPDKMIFKVKKEITIHKDYIERIVPVTYEPLYTQLSQLDIAIPHIEEMEVKDNQLYIIEEYIDKPLLSDYMKDHTFNEKEIGSIFRQLCDILHVLHNQIPPIIHRDIKPENIFYDGHQLILGDFDIARNESDRNKDTQVLGSIGYASPEQFGLAQSTTLSDIYSLGILLNVLLTKELPSVQLSKGAFRSIIVKATSTIQSERFQNVDEMKKAILIASHEMFSFTPPGFRTGNKLYMVIAGVAYLIILYFTIYTEISQLTVNSFFSALCILLLSLYTVAIFTNYCDIHGRYPRLFGGSFYQKWLKIIGIYLLGSSIIFVFLAILSGVFETIF